MTNGGEFGSHRQVGGQHLQAQLLGGLQCQIMQAEAFQPRGPISKMRRDWLEISCAFFCPEDFTGHFTARRAWLWVPDCFAADKLAMLNWMDGIVSRDLWTICYINKSTSRWRFAYSFIPFAQGIDELDQTGSCVLKWFTIARRSYAKVSMLFSFFNIFVLH